MQRLEIECAIRALQGVLGLMDLGECFEEDRERQIAYDKAIEDLINNAKSLLGA